MKRWSILIVIAVAGLTGLVLGDIYYRAELKEDNQVALNGAIENAAHILTESLLLRTGAVYDLRAFMLSSLTVPDEDDFARYATHAMEHVPDLRALQYANPDLTITYVYPLEGNEAALGLDLRQRPAADDARAAMETRRMTLNDPAPLAQGPLGTVIRVPLFDDDTFLGLVQGVIEVEPWLEDVSGELGDAFAMQLRGNEGQVFWGPDTLAGETQSEPINAGIGSWTLTVGWARGAPGRDPLFVVFYWGMGLLFLATLVSFVRRTMTRADWLAHAVEARTSELSQSERRYRTLVQQAHDAILITDAQGNYLEANDAALRMLGYLEEELLALNARDVVPAFEQEEVPLRFTQVANGERVLSERWLQRKDGNLVLAESSATKLPDGRFLGILRDITDRREAEDALRRGEAILQAVSYSAEQFLRSGAWQQQIDEVLAHLGRAAGASRAYIFKNEQRPGGQLLAHYIYEWAAPGVSPQLDVPEMKVLAYDEIGATTWPEIFARGEVIAGPTSRFAPELREILKAQEVLSLVVVPILAGESWWGFMGFDDCQSERRWSQAEVDALKAAADILGAAISNAGLIEESRRLLQQSREQAQQVQQIMETVPDGVILLDARQKILVANPSARDYLAQIGDATVGNVLEQVGEHRLQELLAAEKESAPWRELHLADSDRVFELATRSIVAREDTVGWVLVIRDVTADRQRQAFLQRQERLATVGQLAAGIAHDFNNILSVITLYSESLQRNLDDTRRDAQLQVIRDQAQYAADLISQILDFSRKAVMARGLLDLLPFVKQTVAVLRRTLPETIGISLTAADGDYTINADPTRLQQAFLNLALNARDAMPQGGELRMKLARFTLLSGQRPPLPDMAPGAWIRLSVEDSGSGIAPEDVIHIFEPFFTTKQPGKGTGLGLAQVYGIVKQHGGEIDVHSEQGAGTTFTIFLPQITPSLQRPRAEHTKQVSAQPQETILLVEDNEMAREAICDALEILGYRMLTAATGSEALALFAGGHREIDLVLSDIYMPEMGGVELYRRLVEMSPDVKMMLMTGYPREGEGRSILEEDRVAWIRKPFSRDEIAAKLRAVLDDGRKNQPDAVP